MLKMGGFSVCLREGFHCVLERSFTVCLKEGVCLCLREGFHCMPHKTVCFSG